MLTRESLLQNDSHDPISTSSLVFHEREILTIAEERLLEPSIFRIFLRQLRHELLVRLLRGANFRQRDNRKATQAYCTIGIEDFEHINARQQWANWRTIPRNLNHHIPNRPLSAIDLCSGTGHSTEVLAHYLPVGSRILGLEFNPEFIKRARIRRYLNRAGYPAHVSFNSQSVLQPFRHPDGTRIANQSQDLVNCSGAVGCHFDSSAASQMIREVVRVLKPGGIAMIDSGPSGTSPRELTRICQSAGLRRIHASRSCIADLYTQIVFTRLV